MFYERRWLVGASLVVLLTCICFSIFEPLKVSDTYQLEPTHSSFGKIKLPYTWTQEQNKHSASQFWFEVNSASLTVDDLALYISDYKQHITISIDGKPLELFGLAPSFSGAFDKTPLYLELDRSWFARPQSNIQIDLDTGQFFLGGLSKVYLGPASLLKQKYDIEYLLNIDSKIFLFFSYLFLLFISVWSFLYRPQDKKAAWLSGFCFISALISIGIFIPRIPQIAALLAFFFLLSPLLPMLLCGFRASFQHNLRLRNIFNVSLLLYFLCVIFLLSINIHIAKIVLFLTLPLCVALSIIVIYIFVSALLKKDNAYDALLVVAILFVFCSSLSTTYDNLVGEYNNIQYTVLARLFLIFAVTLVLIHRQTNISRALDESAMLTLTKLKEQERVLTTLYQEKNIRLQQRTKEIERHRITSDLHDGVAGHLITIIALTEASKDKHKTINEIAYHALNDLRMVVETLSLSDGELRPALAAFRERFVAPLHYLNIEINWELIELPEISYLTAEQVLSILRILQEAVTNALKHGKPKTIQIYGSQASSNMALLRVKSTGGIAYNNKEKNGIINMQSRAQKLAGQCKILSHPSGAIVEILIPIKSPT